MTRSAPPLAVVVVALVLVVVALLVVAGTVLDAVRRHRRLAAQAAQAHADYVLARAARLAVEGPGELEGEARRIEAQGERDGRYGYGALLVTWRDVADQLPRDVVDAVEGRPPVDPTRDPATGFRVIRHRA